MKQQSKILGALGAIALGAAMTPAGAATVEQQSDAAFESECARLQQQSDKELQQYIIDNPDSSCVEVAALLLAERTQPAAGVSAPLGARAVGRY